MMKSKLKKAKNTLYPSDFIYPIMFTGNQGSEISSDFVKLR